VKLLNKLIDFFKSYDNYNENIELNKLMQKSNIGKLRAYLLTFDNLSCILNESKKKYPEIFIHILQKCGIEEEDINRITNDDTDIVFYDDYISVSNEKIGYWLDIKLSKLLKAIIKNYYVAIIDIKREMVVLIEDTNKKITIFEKLVEFIRGNNVINIKYLNKFIQPEVLKVMKKVGIKGIQVFNAYWFNSDDFLAFLKNLKKDHNEIFEMILKDCNYPEEDATLVLSDDIDIFYSYTFSQGYPLPIDINFGKKRTKTVGFCNIELDELFGIMFKKYYYYDCLPYDYIYLLPNDYSLDNSPYDKDLLIICNV